MATQIVILNGDYINVDNEFLIKWTQKGTAWNDAWLPDTIHCVLWNNLPGQNEIQNKDASTGNMTGNTNLSATSDAAGTTTVAALLTWAETRKLQIEEAETDFQVNREAGTLGDKTSWKDYDPHYS